MEDIHTPFSEAWNTSRGSAQIRGFALSRGGLPRIVPDMNRVLISAWIGLCLACLSFSSAYALDPGLFDGSEEEITQTTNAPPEEAESPPPDNVKTGSVDTENDGGKGTMTNKMEQVERPELPETVEPEAPVLPPLTRRSDLPPPEERDTGSDTNAPALNTDLEKFIPSENISSDAAVAFPVDI